MARKARTPGQLPLSFMVPETSWAPPTELPDWRGAPVLAFDVETCDRLLSAERGSGWVLRDGGYVAGVAMAVPGRSVYVPIRHPESPECFDEEQVRRWVDDHMRAAGRVVMHHSPYDLGWLSWWGIQVPRTIEDTLTQAVMLDENRLSYTLGAVCEWQGVPGKDEKILREAAQAYGVDPKKELWKLPARFVGPYAEQDATAALELWETQRAKITAQELDDPYRTEMRLVPLVLEMRRRGIRVDLDKAEQAQQHFYGSRDEALAELSRNVAIGRALTQNDINSPQFLERLFTDAGIQFPRTATGRPSFSADWMDKADHWLPRLIVRANRADEVARKFIGSYILEYANMGRLHAEIHQYRTDDGGTRSHRFSYSDPPLQQMPSRDAIVAPVLRGCFLPEKDEVWGALDYSQQEFRLIVHYAAACGMPGADVAVERYRENPRTDFHTFVADITRLPRRSAKDVNFAKAFGAGKHKFALMTNMQLAEAGEVMEQYDRELPFVSRLSKFCSSKVRARGYIRMVDGARGHFDQWEPAFRDRAAERTAAMAGKKVTPCSLEEARERVDDEAHPWTGRLVRAFAHKAMNRLIQGSAARQTKKAMVACWEEGIVPMLQMHDDLNFSIDSPRVAERAAQIMVEVVPLQVPVVVDVEYGADWGDAKHTDWDAVAARAAGGGAAR